MKRFIIVALLCTLVVGTSAGIRRIVGGYFAEEEQFPYQVALFKNETFVCGGSIIDEKWILTAAHCLYDLNGDITPISQFKILAGTPHLCEGGQYLELEAFYPHESYAKLSYDIALIKLKKAIKFDKTMAKIELYTGDLPTDANVTISGHGRTGQGEPISEHLKYNYMKAIESEECYKYISRESLGVICFNNEIQNGICTGDSGGPAVYKGKQVGVANFTIGSCGSIYPDGYASVPYFAEWIAKTMKK